MNNDINSPNPNNAPPPDENQNPGGAGSADNDAAPPPATPPTPPAAAGAPSPPPEDDDEEFTEDEIDEAVRPRFKIDNYSVSGIWRAVREYWSSLEKKTRRYFTVFASLIFISVIILTVILNRSPMVPLFSFIADETEAMEMMSVLESAGIRHDYDPLFRRISVRQKDRTRAWAALAAEGYPGSGVSYTEELQGTLLESGDDRRNREIRNLESRLEAVIKNIHGVRSASVNLVIPPPRNILLQSQREYPSASVQVTLMSGFTLSDKAVLGIEGHVRSAVPGGLERERITITDNFGNILNVELDSDSPSARFSTIAEFTRNFEREAVRDLVNDLEESLSRVFGGHRIVVSGSVKYNFDELIQDAIVYSGSNIDEDTGEQRGLRSRIASDHIARASDDSGAGGVISEPNMDDPAYFDFINDTDDPAFWEQYHRTEELMVNRMHTQTQRLAPVLEEMTLTVYIDVRELDMDLEERMIFAAATGSGIMSLARRNLPPDEYTVDIDHLRTYITVVGHSFHRPPPLIDPYEDPGQIFRFLVIMSLAAIVVLILLSIIIANSNKRRREREEREMAALAAESSMAAIDPAILSLGMAAGQYAASMQDDGEDDETNSRLKQNKEATIKREIKRFIDQHPDTAAQLIRTLLKGDEMRNG
jgi:flagellar biosynthesis/type III secretory pathway M-ring protein FliF/YscJ